MQKKLHSHYLLKDLQIKADRRTMTAIEYEQMNDFKDRMRGHKKITGDRKKQHQTQFKALDNYLKPQEIQDEPKLMIRDLPEPHKPTPFFSLKHQRPQSAAPPLAIKSSISPSSNLMSSVAGEMPTGKMIVKYVSNAPLGKPMVRVSSATRLSTQ